MRHILIQWCRERVKLIRDHNTDMLTERCGYGCTGDHELIQLGTVTT